MKFSRNISFLFISLALLAYTVYRAAHISFVYDESLTYFSFVNQPLKSVIKYDFLTANNHVLNSVLMKFSANLLPVNQLTMRLPNLLAHVVFLFFSYCIARHYKPFYIQLCIFLFLNLNPFLLDFFSLARGYGLSMAFTLASLYFLQVFFRTGKPGIYISMAMFLMAALAVLANFSLLNFYCALFGLFTLRLLFYHAISLRGKMLHFTVALIITAALFSYVLPVSIRLREANELYFGGTTGFWQDTVTSLVQGFLYGQTYAATTQFIIQILIVLSLAAGLVYTAYILFRKNTSAKTGSAENLFLPGLLLLLILCAASTIVQYHLLGTKYLTERTALFFIPVFGVFVAELFYRFYLAQKHFTYAIFLFTALIFVHFAMTVNFGTVHIWKDSSRQMLNDLSVHLTAAKPGKPVKIEAMWAYEITLNFYRTTGNLNWLQPVKTIDTATYTQADFLFIDQATLNSIDTAGFQRLKYYPQTHSFIFSNLRKQQ